jgi:hypothetical protein
MNDGGTPIGSMALTPTDSSSSTHTRVSTDGGKIDVQAVHLGEVDGVQGGREGGVREGLVWEQDTFGADDVSGREYAADSVSKSVRSAIAAATLDLESDVYNNQGVDLKYPHHLDNALGDGERGTWSFTHSAHAHSPRMGQDADGDMSYMQDVLFVTSDTTWRPNDSISASPPDLNESTAHLRMEIAARRRCHGLPQHQVQKVAYACVHLCVCVFVCG